MPQCCETFGHHCWTNEENRKLSANIALRGENQRNIQNVTILEIVNTILNVVQPIVKTVVITVKVILRNKKTIVTKLTTFFKLCENHCE